MLKSLKIRLYPTAEQEIYIGKLLGSYRYVYNQCLARKKKSYTEGGKSENLTTLSRFFHGELLKDENISWIREHNTKVLKQSIMNMLNAYKNFFEQPNKDTGFPKFKSKYGSKATCRFPVEAISKRNDYSSGFLTLTGQLKNMRFRTSDKYQEQLTKHKENIRSATLTKAKSGKYFLSVLIDVPITRQLKRTENAVGIDIGIKTFVVTSDGESFENIKIKRNNQLKLAKLHRSVSRKEKGSSNREKSRLKLARYYEKLTNRKENYLHHVSNTLLNENQVIVTEDLNVKGMMMNHCIARSVQELSISRFVSMLEYKSLWYDRDFIQVDRYFPSSKNCNECGNKKKDLKLSHRTYKCTQCGYENDRDLNAALNILDEGLRVYKEKIPVRSGKLTPLESSR